ncbi:hypothetical protein [Tenacibaculum piscium]|uniref:hypothetical protein n=1 Tax=Tenacibaculum piscium TaxID=1458515 RepID=UPI001F241A36|nr:hypothetical protein [Tenacibaculum piscium]
MDISELKKQLPAHGINEISKLSGLHIATVNRFFYGGKVKSETEMKIITATTDFFKSEKERKANALKELNEVVNS